MYSKGSSLPTNSPVSWTEQLGCTKNSDPAVNTWISCLKKNIEEEFWQTVCLAKKHMGNWCLTPHCCSTYQWGMNEQIQIRDFSKGMMLSDMKSVFPVLDAATEPKLVRWQFKQIPHSFMDGCTLWLPRGAFWGQGRTVIFRPIKSRVQVCGIIHHPKGLATSSAITACLQP